MSKIMLDEFKIEELKELATDHAKIFLKAVYGIDEEAVKTFARNKELEKENSDLQMDVYHQKVKVSDMETDVRLMRAELTRQVELSKQLSEQNEKLRKDAIECTD